MTSHDAESSVGDDVRARLFARPRDRVPQPPAGIVRTALAVCFAVHVLVILGLYFGMRPAPVSSADSIKVQIYDTPAAEPPLPEPPTPQHVSAAPPTARSKAVANTPPGSSQPNTSPVPTSSEAPALPSSQLFNADGSIRLAPTQKATGQAAEMQRSAELMARGHNVLHCKQARYASGYKKDESVGDEVARKYLSWVGLYNPYSAKKLADREAAAALACDEE